MSTSPTHLQEAAAEIEARPGFREKWGDDAPTVAYLVAQGFALALALGDILGTILKRA